jgi:hypothetical protein
MKTICHQKQTKGCFSKILDQLFKPKIGIPCWFATTPFWIYSSNKICNSTISFLEVHTSQEMVDVEVHKIQPYNEEQNSTYYMPYEKGKKYTRPHAWNWLHCNDLTVFTLPSISQEQKISMLKTHLYNCWWLQFFHHALLVVPPQFSFLIFLLLKTMPFWKESKDSP